MALIPERRRGRPSPKPGKRRSERGGTIVTVRVYINGKLRFSRNASLIRRARRNYIFEISNDGERVQIPRSKGLRSLIREMVKAK